MFIIFFSLLCCLVTFWGYRKLSSKTNVLVPKLTKALNFLEFGLFKFNFNDLCKRILDIGEYTNENGGVTRFNYGPVPVYVVSDAQDMVTVLNKCTKKIFIYDLIKPYIGSQLVVADFPVWKRNRRLLDLAFKQNILNGYIDIFNSQASRLATTMAKYVNKETDFSSVIGRSFMETTCPLGTVMNGQVQIVDRYIQSVEKVMEVMTKRFRQPWLLFDFVFKLSSLKKEQDEALKTVRDFSEEVIKKKKIELSQPINEKRNGSDEDKKFHSVLDILIENRDDNEHSNLHLRELIDQIILGAFETNISGLLFSLLCIGSYPEVQKKVYEEVISVTGKSDRDIQKEDLPKLVYLEAAIKEAIRLYPPGIILGRTATSDVQLKDYILPDGCHIVLHLAGVNRNKNYWGQDSDQYRPERWFDALPDEFAAFATFSPGRRGCIGKNYALMVLKITVAKLIKKFHISGSDKNLDLQFIIFLKPTAGHLIKLELREQESETKH